MSEQGTVEAVVEPSASPEARFAINPKAYVWAVIASIGAIFLLLAIVLIRDPVWSKSVLIIGGGVWVAAHLLMPSTPSLLPISNIGVALALTLQVIGVCTAQCGGFQDYTSFAGIPTTLIGIIAHSALAGVGWMRSSLHWIPVDVYRGLLGVGHGVSLFFSVIMIMYGHWCSSCAAAHVLLVGQAILLLRLTPDGKQRAIWILSVVASAFAVNAIYHHRIERKPLAPGDALVGHLAQAESEGRRIATIVVAPADLNPSGKGEKTAARETRASKPSDVPASKKDKASDPDKGANASPIRKMSYEERGQVLSNLLTRTESPHEPDGSADRHARMHQWGNPQAPVVIRVHMNPGCPHCQEVWKDISVLRSVVERNEASVEFYFTWPIKPTTNYGSQLAVYVLYAAGELGEREMLAVADKMFSPAGITLQTQLNTTLRDSMVNGEIPLPAQSEALAALMAMCDPMVPGKLLGASFLRNQNEIDKRIKANLTWLMDYGALDTPHFFYLRRGATTPYLHNTTLDGDVVKAYLMRGKIEAVQQPNSSGDVPR